MATSGIKWLLRYFMYVYILYIIRKIQMINIKYNSEYVIIV